MAVMAREQWTDERLDDLTKRVDRGFDESKVEIRDLRSDMNKGFERVDKDFERVDADIREVRAEIGGVRSDMKTGFDEVNARFDGLNARFDAMQRNFDSMQRVVLIGFVTLFASIAASVIGGILATQL
jgi:hypothetical protein